MKRTRKKVVGETASRGTRGKGRLATLVVAVGVLVTLAIAADVFANSGTIRRGVEVGGVPVGGKSPDEARAVLEQLSVDRLQEIKLVGPVESYSVPTKDLGARLDVEATIDKAYAVGRRGNVLEQLLGRVYSAFGKSVSAEVRYSPEAVQTVVEDLAVRANREPKNASVEVSGASVEVAEPAKGYSLNVPATAENLEVALENLASEAEMVGKVRHPRVTRPGVEDAVRRARAAVAGPLVLTAKEKIWTISPADVGSALTFSEQEGVTVVRLDRDRLKGHMADVYASLNVEPVEAGYDVAVGGERPEIEVTPGREGKRVEETKLLRSIEEGIFEGERRYAVPVATARPDLTTGEAESLKPTELLGSYRTNYAVVPDTGARVENLEISSSAVNGTLLAPGEVFSMNAHVSGLDYNESKVIVDGEETNADGGGLCQVTSTLYNAANFAGLDVIERTPHSAQLPYIRPGMDATVWWGGPGEADDLDMKFRNTTNGYLLLREYVAEDGYVYSEIWGRPNGTEVEMRSKPTYMNKNGSGWITYQTIEKNGEIVFDGILHRDTYDPLVDTDGEEIPPSEVPVAPVAP